MSDIVTINITQQAVTVNVAVTEVLGKDGLQGPPGTTYEDASFEFTGSTNSTVTIPHTYKPGSGRLYKNDSRLKSAAFTEASANTITLNVARLADDEFIFDYKH